MTEAEHCIPSAYSSLPGADQGIRAQTYAEIPAPSVTALRATIVYCDYVFRRYGRFPAYTAPFRTVIGFQVCRVDVDFYARFYDPGAVSDTVRASTKEVLGKP
jgi:hypothetical protein